MNVMLHLAMQQPHAQCAVVAQLRTAVAPSERHVRFMHVQCVADESTCTKQRSRKDLRKRLEMHKLQLLDMEASVGEEDVAAGRECVHLARLSWLCGDTQDFRRLLGQAQRVCRVWQAHFDRRSDRVDRCFARLQQLPASLKPSKPTVQPAPLPQAVHEANAGQVAT
jgi:hypothetical protein